MTSTTTEVMEWFRAGEIASAKRKCAGIFDCGILATDSIGHPLFEAAVTQLLIGLSDLCQKARIDGKRIAITDNVEVTEDRADVTDLIRDCRNASCHIYSGIHNLGTNRFAFNVFVGKNPKAFKTDDVFLGCEFEDDIAVYWGTTRLYLRRNAAAAFEAALKVYPDGFILQA